MKTRIAPVIFLGSVVALVFAAGRDDQSTKNGKPDYSGNWELNTTKSKFGNMPVPSRMTLQATHRVNTLHSVQTSYDQAGGPNAIEGDWFLDGKEHPIGSDGKMTSMSRWDGNTLVSERKSKDGSYDEVIRLRMSSDGKMATEQIHLKSPNGNNNSTLIWDRK